MIQHSRGFSLVEVLVVVGIMALLGTVSVSTYVEYKKNTNAETARLAFEKLVSTAQLYARTGYHDEDWSLFLEEDRAVVFAGDDFSTRDESFDVELEILETISITGPETLTFLQVTGYPSESNSYTITTDEEEVVISINAYGTLAVE